MSSGGETFWIFLSLLQLPIDVQLKAIDGIPNEGEDFENDFSQNPMSLLISAMQIYYNGWFDEFFPNCKSAELLFDHLNSMESAPMNVKNFVGSEYWCTLRRLAGDVLAEAGLGCCDVPEKINFDEYIEVVRPNC